MSLISLALSSTFGRGEAEYSMPFSAALRRMERMRAWVYWMNGPVLPLKSMDSFGLKSMVFFGSTLMMKYLRAPRPIMR